jgi:hypothetical protein
MLTLTEGQEEQVREAAARNGEPPERLLARVVALGLAQLAAEAQQGLEPGPGGEEDRDDGDGYRPPFGAAAAAEHGLEMPGRGHVPEPKAPRLFRARAPDGGLVLHSQIAFGPEAGPSLAVRAGGRHAWTDVVMPLHWVLSTCGRSAGGSCSGRRRTRRAGFGRAGRCRPATTPTRPGATRCPDGPRAPRRGFVAARAGSGRGRGGGRPGECAMPVCCRSAPDGKPPLSGSRHGRRSGSVSRA